MSNTYKTMTVEHLGDNANQADLDSFRRACERRQKITGETAAEVTEFYWGDGDWQERIKHPAGCSCGSERCPEWQAAQAGL